VPIFFLLFVLLPLFELWLLIKVGTAIGGWLMLSWLIASGVLGVSILKRQGLVMLWGVHHKMRSGEMQVTELAQGVLLAIAGLLLLIPGLLTDCLGLILLSPQVRRLCARWLLQRMSIHLSQVQTYSYREPAGDETEFRVRRNQDIIEGEFHEVDDDRNLPKN
jgi:UPF0716 protein FxsA